MEPITTPTSHQQTLTLKQKVLILGLSIVIIWGALYLQKIRNAEQEKYTESLSESAQIEKDQIQTSIYNYCKADWEKFCKAHIGVEAYSCLKNSSSNLEPGCKSFITGEQ